MEQKFVVFKVDNEIFGLPISDVERILSERPVTRVPRSPKIVTGIFELYGTTIPVVDMRLRFDRTPFEGEAKFVVVFVDEERVALRVDDMSGIYELTEEDVDRDTSFIAHKDDDFIAGIGKHGEELILLIEPKNLIPAKDRQKTLKLVQAA